MFSIGIAFSKWVRVPPPAPRQNKAMRSCGGTSTATSTDDLVFPFQPRPADAGLASDRGTASDSDCPGAPRVQDPCNRGPVLLYMVEIPICHRASVALEMCCISGTGPTERVYFSVLILHAYFIIMKIGQFLPCVQQG